jgi:integrase
MPYRDVPEFMTKLKQSESLGARALEFAILTGGRTREVINAKWDEFDTQNGIWTVPAERMKNRKEHRVPLNAALLSILETMRASRINDFIFFGQKPNKPLSDMSLEMQMRRLNAKPYTVHGFRSSFREWVGDETEFSEEAAEKSLSHQYGSAVVRAYRRSDALDKRRILLNAWADFVLQQIKG